MGDHQPSCATRVENDVVVNIRKAKTDFPFAAREGCVACGLDNRVYVFGGVIQSNHAEPQETNDLLLFNIGEQNKQKTYNFDY